MKELNKGLLTRVKVDYTYSVISEYLSMIEASFGDMILKDKELNHYYHAIQNRLSSLAGYDKCNAIIEEQADVELYCTGWKNKRDKYITIPNS